MCMLGNCGTVRCEEGCSGMNSIDLNNLSFPCYLGELGSVFARLYRDTDKEWRGRLVFVFLLLC